MKYFDMTGAPLEREDWQRMFRLPQYTRVARHVYGQVSVDTSWVGIQTSYCTRPTMFVTIARQLEEATMVFWHDDRVSISQVKEFHLSTCKEIGIPLSLKEVS